MILQIGKKGTDNVILTESRIIESFSVGNLKEKMCLIEHNDSLKGLAARQKNHAVVEEEIKQAGFCRENIVWYLGDPALEENDCLKVVTTDDATYVFSIIGCENLAVFILNNSGKTISRVL